MAKKKINPPDKTRRNIDPLKEGIADLWLAVAELDKRLRAIERYLGNGPWAKKK